MGEEIKSPEEGSSNKNLIPAAIIIAGVLIAGSVIYSNSNSRGFSNNALIGSSPKETEVGNLTDNDPSLGDPDAPVTIVEFGDFQCPFCGRFFETTEKDIIEKYVKTGKVRFVYRDFPLSSIHNMAQKSAEAAECANEQNKFWQYHDLLYSRQGSLSVLNFKKWALELGLNQARFDSCLDSDKYFEEVQKDFNDGTKAGVSGTPANFVNGRLISGAVPFAQFQQAIEEELKKVQN